MFVCVCLYWLHTKADSLSCGVWVGDLEGRRRAQGPPNVSSLVCPVFSLIHIWCCMGILTDSRVSSVGILTASRISNMGILTDSRASSVGILTDSKVSKCTHLNKSY